MKTHRPRKRNDRIQSVHIRTPVIERCTVVESLVDLHRVDHYVPWSSQHGTDLEDQVRERMLERKRQSLAVLGDAEVGAMRIRTETLGPSGY